MMTGRRGASFPGGLLLAVGHSPSGHSGTASGTRGGPSGLVQLVQGGSLPPFPGTGTGPAGVAITMASQDTPEYWDWLANHWMSEAERVMNLGAPAETVQEYLDGADYALQILDRYPAYVRSKQVPR